MNSNNTINDIICQLHFVLKQLTEIVEKLSSPENQPETNEKLSRTFTVDRSEHITFKATSKVLSCVEELRKKKHYLKKLRKDAYTAVQQHQLARIRRTKSKNDGKKGNRTNH